MFLVSKEIFYSLEDFLLDEFENSSPGAMYLAEKGINAASFYRFFHNIRSQLQLSKTSIGFTDTVIAIMQHDDLAEQFSVGFLVGGSDDDPDNIENWVSALEDEINKNYKISYKIQENFQSYLKNRHGLEDITKVSQLSDEIKTAVESELFNNAKVVSSWQVYRHQNSTSPFSDSEQSSVSSKRSTPDITDYEHSDSEKEFGISVSNDQIKSEQTSKARAVKVTYYGSNSLFSSKRDVSIAVIDSGNEHQYKKARTLDR